MIEIPYVIIIVLTLILGIILGVLFAPRQANQNPNNPTVAEEDRVSSHDSEEDSTEPRTFSEEEQEPKNGNGHPRLRLRLQNVETAQKEPVGEIIAGADGFQDVNAEDPQQVTSAMRINEDDGNDAGTLFIITPMPRHVDDSADNAIQNTIDARGHNYENSDGEFATLRSTDDIYGAAQSTSTESTTVFVVTPMPSGPIDEYNNEVDRQGLPKAFQDNSQRVEPISHTYSGVGDTIDLRNPPAALREENEQAMASSNQNQGRHETNRNTVGQFDFPTGPFRGPIMSPTDDRQPIDPEGECQFVVTPFSTDPKQPPGGSED